MAYPDDPGQDHGAGDGRGLRAQLESALQQNRQLESEVSEYRASKVLGDKGFDLVKPADLKGIDPASIETKAAELQAERQKLQQELLRDALQKQGFKEDELEDAVNSLAASKARDSAGADALDRMRALGGTGGDPVPLVNPDKLHGYDALKAAVENPRPRRR